MNAARIPFALAIAALCCVSAPYTDVSWAASASSQAQQQAPVENTEGTSSFHELIFEKEFTGGFTASTHKFVVTPQTAFVDRYGAKITLSSIRQGSIVRVRYRQENDKDPMVAVKVMVAQGPGE